MGNKICKETSSGVVVASLNAWNEDKSMAQLKVITSPGGTLDGESLAKGNTFWVKASGAGWHLCLDEEVQTSLANDASAEKSPQQVIIPTQEDKSCYKCGGRGACVKCNGKGVTACDYHDTDRDGNCTNCKNRGVLNCYTCDNTGSCPSCKGTGKRR